MSDDVFMRRALQLAVRGFGAVEPNPMVGAVIVRDGRIVAEGWHRRFGGPHAEIDALGRCGDPRGATMYVTLEPCCHHGKTPPCADALIAAGLRRVVAAMADPFPAVAGKGLERLRAAGVEVEVGVCEPAARRVNAVFLKRLATGLPYVIAKWARTADGCLSGPGGRRQQISCGAAGRQVHRIRGRVDAVLVGVGTVLADDPLLTNRSVPGGGRQPTRIVLDSRLRTPPDGRLMASIQAAPLWIATRSESLRAAGSAATPAHRLAAAGARLIAADGDGGRVDLAAVLRACGEAGMHRVLIEGGPTVLAAALAAGLIDQAIVYTAPRRLGEGMGEPTAARLPEAAERIVRAAAVAGERRVGADVRTDFILREY